MLPDMHNVCQANSEPQLTRGRQMLSPGGEARAEKANAETRRTPRFAEVPIGIVVALALAVLWPEKEIVPLQKK